MVLTLSVLSIPFLVLWNTSIPCRKKLILLSMFSATILIMICAIVRVAVGTKYDRQINIDWLCFWSFIEVDIGKLSQMIDWSPHLFDFDLLAIIVSCVTSLRQLFINSQNQGSSGNAAYQNTHEPMLKKSKESSSHIISRSIEDIESGRLDDVPMSPLSIVHVRQDYEVFHGARVSSENYGKPF